MANFVAFQVGAFQAGAFQDYVVEISLDDLRRFSKVYSLAEDKSLVACSASETEFVFSQLETLTVSTGTNQIFIQHKPRRDAPPEV
jgi:hypothetical protein